MFKVVSLSEINYFKFPIQFEESSTFAHPNITIFKSVETVVNKHIRAENIATINADLAPLLDSLAKGVQGLETCNELGLVFLTVIHSTVNTYSDILF